MQMKSYIALDKLVIAIVDDNPFFRRIVRAMLVGFGVRQVIEAATTLEGWRVISTQSPDILLLDWKLSVGDGAKLLNQIRTNPDDAIATMAVMFISAHGDKRHVLMANKLGANDFLVKPISPRILYDRLTRLVASRFVYERRGDRLSPHVPVKQPLRGQEATVRNADYWMVDT
jgi:two-component system chemotaxis response regulator CheY